MRRLPVIKTVAEAAEIMRVSTKTVYRMVKDETLGVQRIEGSMFIRESDIAEYMDDQYRPATSPPRRDRAAA